MNCMFEGPQAEVPPGPSHNILHPVSETDAAVGPAPTIEGLPSLEEFCKNTPVVNNIYNMLQRQDEGMLEFLNSLEGDSDVCMGFQLESTRLSEGDPPIITQLADPPLMPELTQPGSESGFSNACTIKENVQQPDFKHSDPEIKFNCHDNNENHENAKDSQNYHKSFTETQYMIPMDTNNNANNGEGFETILEAHSATTIYTELVPAVSQQDPFNNSMDHPTPTIRESDHQEQQIPINETDIDNAMQSVLDHLGQLTQKEMLQTVDQSIIENCLEDIVHRNFHICGRCHSIFDSIPVFQLHIQTCIDPPRAELKSKMDSSAMDGLARAMWKQVFLSELKKHPTAAHFLKQLDHLQHELDQIWEMSLLDTVVWCRQVFIKAAVEIVKRRWITTAFANESRTLAAKNARKMKGPPRKRTKSEPIDEVQDIASQASTTNDNSQLAMKKRGRPKRQSKTETEVALDGLISDTGNEFPGTSQQFNFTPETPISEFGFDSGPSSPVLCKRKPKATAIQRSHVELESDFEPEIERIVRNDDAVNDEAVAAAAKTIEGLDEIGNWENVQAEEPVEFAEDEYLVREILHRRLVNDIVGKIPTEEDFEYLVAWEGYGSDENTWEPYNHLKHCVDKLKAFHEGLKTKALRKRKGKRM